MSNLDIAAEVSLQLALRERRVAKGWSFRPGVVMFPEVRCPYCSSVVKSTAIWLLSQTQLLGQGIPRHGREFKLDSQRHPHAIGGTGDICFGDAVDAMTALFGGLNPESVYFDMAEWLQGKYWGHSCEEMDQGYRCESCELRLSEDDRYYFSGSTYCEGCFSEVAFNCWSCGDDYSIDDQCSSPNGESYCHGCWSQNWFRCHGCSESTSHDDQMTGADDEEYCSDCWCDEFFSCSDCGEATWERDRRGEDECSECYEEPEEESESEAEPERNPDDTSNPCSICTTTPTLYSCDTCEMDFCSEHADVPCQCPPAESTTQQELPL